MKRDDWWGVVKPKTRWRVDNRQLDEFMRSATSQNAIIRSLKLSHCNSACANDVTRKTGVCCIAS
jgi:hypothetical protein